MHQPVDPSIRASLHYHVEGQRIHLQAAKIPRTVILYSPAS